VRARKAETLNKARRVTGTSNTDSKPACLGSSVTIGPLLRPKAVARQPNGGAAEAPALAGGGHNLFARQRDQSQRAQHSAEPEPLPAPPESAAARERASLPPTDADPVERPRGRGTARRQAPSLHGGGGARPC
jgi:hypothetical protein